MRQVYGLEVQLDSEPFAKIQHVFSHLTWDIDVYGGTVSIADLKRENSRLVKAEEVERYAFSVSHQKIWKKARQK